MQNDPRELLARAANLIDARGGDYGGIENNFQLISDLSTLRLGRKIHPYEVATILACVKQARLFANPTHTDSRLDLCNYETFAALFAADYAASFPNEVEWRKRDTLHKAEAAMPPVAETETPRTKADLDALMDELNAKVERRTQRQKSEPSNGGA